VSSESLDARVSATLLAASLRFLSSILLAPLRLFGKYGHLLYCEAEGREQDRAFLRQLHSECSLLQRYRALPLYCFKAPSFNPPLSHTHRFPSSCPSSRDSTSPDPPAWSSHPRSAVSPLAAADSNPSMPPVHPSQSPTSPSSTRRERRANLVGGRLSSRGCWRE
jgi:hypothetical protein